MNISTYESRIKALEDQLNPPAPGGSTGLLSVVVTPDITLSDGTSLNARLAAMMPLEPGASQHIEDANAEIDEDANYTVTATPGSGWYGEVHGEIAGEAIGDTVGVPVSLILSPVDKSDGYIRLSAGVGASSTGTEEGQASVVLLDLSHKRQE